MLKGACLQLQLMELLFHSLVVNIVMFASLFGHSDDECPIDVLEDMIKTKEGKIYLDYILLLLADFFVSCSW